MDQDEHFNFIMSANNGDACCKFLILLIGPNCYILINLFDLKKQIINSSTIIPHILFTLSSFYIILIS